jgi:DNA-directed RNA polymerase sigma subunit (sigma70/sigma32)
LESFSQTIPEDKRMREKLNISLNKKYTDQVDCEDSTSGEPELFDLAQKEEVALIPYDPLQIYLREIRQFKLLTREEEMELAKKVKEEGREAYVSFMVDPAPDALEALFEGDNRQLPQRSWPNTGGDSLEGNWISLIIGSWLKIQYPSAS